MVTLTRWWMWAPMSLVACAPSPHIYDFDGGPRACQTVEVCNGVDDDCNGVVDDLGEDVVGPSALNQAGECADTLQVCVDGAWRDPMSPEDERGADQECDGQDNDCDGRIDEDYDPADRRCAPNRCTALCCDVARMHCLEGEAHCLVRDDSVDVTVFRLPFSVEEECDEIDNDCDGDTDEGDACGLDI